MNVAHRSKGTLALLFGCSALLLAAPSCGGDDDGGGNGGATAKGGGGGSTAGGKANGGSTAGGKANGGSTNGGSTAGGKANGGSTSGGSTNGGSTSGGSANGGSAGVGEGGMVVVTGGVTGEGGAAPQGGVIGTGGEMPGGAAGMGGVTAEGGTTAEGGAGGVTSVAPILNNTFDSSTDGWAPFKYWDGCTSCYSTGVTLTAASGVATLTLPLDTAANTAIWTSTLGTTTGAPWSNLGGKTVTVKMRWVSGGIGPATGATGGFDVYIIASDGDWTEGSGNFQFVGSDAGATAFKEFAFTIPDANGSFDPATIQRLAIRIDTKFWTNSTDPQPVFDYVPAVFEIDSVVVQ